MNETDFIRKIIIQDIRTMQEKGLHYLSFSIIALAVETLGAFLDNKPFRAEKQSKKRFGTAISVLFDKKYSRANRDGILYEKLRNHMAHNLVPSPFLILLNRDSLSGEEEHLSYDGEKLILVAEDFYNDLKNAAEKLIKLIEKGKIPAKKIGAGFLRFGNL